VTGCRKSTAWFLQVPRNRFLQVLRNRRWSLCRRQGTPVRLRVVRFLKVPRNPGTPRWYPALHRCKTILTRDTVVSRFHSHSHRAMLAQNS
jgi:hypothetical protein